MQKAMVMMLIPHEELETKESARLKTCCCCLITKGRKNVVRQGEAWWLIGKEEGKGVVQGLDNLHGIIVFIFSLSLFKVWTIPYCNNNLEFMRGGGVRRNEGSRRMNLESHTKNKSSKSDFCDLLMACGDDETRPL